MKRSFSVKKVMQYICLMSIISIKSSYTMNSNEQQINNFELFKQVIKMRDTVASTAKRIQHEPEGLILSFVKGRDVSADPYFFTNQTEQGLFLECRDGLPVELFTPWGLVYLLGTYKVNWSTVPKPPEIIEIFDTTEQLCGKATKVSDQNPYKWVPGVTYKVEMIDSVQLAKPIMRSRATYIKDEVLKAAWVQLEKRYEQEAK